jgi:hypothetical protein
MPGPASFVLSFFLSLSVYPASLPLSFLSFYFALSPQILTIVSLKVLECSNERKEKKRRLLVLNPSFSCGC